jgi:hypothetical protein
MIKRRTTMQALIKLSKALGFLQSLVRSDMGASAGIAEVLDPKGLRKGMKRRGTN